VARLADALGVDGIITGSVGQFGPSFTANINIVASGDGRLLGSVVVRADSEKQLLDRLAVEAQRAAAEVGSRLGKPVRRYFSQALDLDPLLLLFGGVRLSYTRPLGDRWSLLVAWSLEVNQVDPEFPNLALSNMDVAAQARYHLLGRAPFGLYLGAGLLIHSTTGFLDDPTVQAAIGVMGAALSAEAGYDLVLFDFLHLGLGFGGFLGLSSFAFAATGGQSGGELRTLQGWALSTRTGFAF